MRKSKDFRACIDAFKSLRARDIEPEQKEALEFAERRLRQLARSVNPSRAEIFRAIKDIAGALIKLIRR